MKADQDRVRMLITQTITMLCKKGLEFETELKVQGLLGVTVDSKDIFLIHLNEKYDNVSDTKDVLQQHDSVATSTGNEKTRFSPPDISPDAGVTGEAAQTISSKGFTPIKKELEPTSPLLSRMDNQPTFSDLHDSMSDLFPYVECHTTGNASALLASGDCSEPGFLMDTDPTIMPNVKDTRGKQRDPSAGIILLDSGDEVDEECTSDYLHKFNFPVPEMDSKNNIQSLVDEKLSLQAAYPQQIFKPSDGLEAQHHEHRSDLDLTSAAGSSQSWAVQPVSRPPFSTQNPGRVPLQGQPMQMSFSPGRFAEFSIGHNRPSAMQSSPNQNVYLARGMPPRRGGPGGHRQPRPPLTNVISPMRPMHINKEMKAQISGSPSSCGSFPSSPIISPAMMRGSPRMRRPRGANLQLRGGVSSSAGAMMEYAEATGAVGATCGGGGSGGALVRMARGSSSVRARSVDGYSYGKQTVTNYICNICNAVYKNHSSLLTHQVKVHGRQKKEGKGRPKMQAMEMYDDDDEDDAEMDDMGNM